MGRCSYCKTIIVFGGERRGHLRFCNENCFQKGIFARIAKSLSDEEIWERATAVHRGICPLCKGPGPVDVHASYRVWSFLIFTASKRREVISCRSCAVKRLRRDIAFSLIFGWWSIKGIGLILTPIQVVRNIISLNSPPDPNRPSSALATAIRTKMAQGLGQQFLKQTMQS